MRLLTSTLLALFVLSGCNCGDPCDPKTDVSRCEGNTVTFCPEPGVDQIIGANQWRHTDCAETSGVCVTTSTSAFCALSSDPTPACDGGSDYACESAQARVYCQEGFATSRYECLSCDTTDAGVSCRGGISSPCASNSDCIPSLVCSSRGFCGKSAG